MIILIIFALFFSCSSNETLLRRINALEKKVNQLHDPFNPGEIINADGIIERWSIENGRVQKLFCSQCKKEGLTSTIQRGWTMTTLMGVSEYWDENGIYHFDDPNYSTTEWSCSQGHNWVEQN